MNEKIYSVLSVGFLQVNCILLECPADDTLYIIDPGSEPERIAAAAESSGMGRKAILLTHAHVDHISAVPELAGHFRMDRVYLHPDDLKLYRSPDNALPPVMPAVKNLPEPEAGLKSEEIRIIHTPGHTRGGVCFHLPGSGLLFSGDTLFRASIGRTDLPGGNHESLLRSIRGKLFNIPDHTTVVPGHGPETSIEYEKKQNPWL